MSDKNNLDTIAKVLDIDSKTLSALYENLLLLSSHEIIEQLVTDKDVFEVEVAEFGTIRLTAKDDGVHYQFIPSTKFSNVVQETLKTKKSMLITSLEKEVVDKFVNTYKGLM